jgi:hypothetical protein
MRFLQFTIGRLALVVIIAAVTFAALKQPEEASAAAMSTLVLATMGLAILGVVYRRERRRAFWVGYLIFGGGYLVASTAPGLKEAMRPRLVTSALIDASFPKIHPKGQEGQQQIAVTGNLTGPSGPASVVQFQASSGGANLPTPGVSTGTLPNASYKISLFGVALSGPSEEYREIGHGSCALLGGLLGGLLGQLALATRDGKRRERTESSGRGEVEPPATMIPRKAPSVEV